MYYNQMTPTERVKTAMNLKEPDKIPPYNPCSWEINSAGDRKKKLGSCEKNR